MKVTIKHISVLGAFKFGCGIYLLALLLVVPGFYMLLSLTSPVRVGADAINSVFAILPLGTAIALIVSFFSSWLGISTIGYEFARLLMYLVLMPLGGGLAFSLIALLFNMIARVLGGFTITMVRQQPPTQNEN
jgi:hypothetical protein